MKRVLLIAGTGTLGASAYPELVRRFDTPQRRAIDARTDAYLANSKK